MEIMQSVNFMRKDHHNQRKARQRSERNIFAKRFFNICQRLKTFQCFNICAQKVLPGKNVVAYFDS